VSVLITGADGQVGRELVRKAGGLGISHSAFGKEDLDVTDAGVVERLIQGQGSSSNLLINLAAYTDVDAAEGDPAGAFRVNARGVHLLAQACARAGMPMIHVSTDYVFGGESGGSFQETDPACPINVYGESKLAGEEALRGVLAEHLILRTSWVFGPRGKNFVRTMLRLAERASEVQVVRDEIGCPTGAAHLAAVLLTLVERMRAQGFRNWGTYHFCGRPPVSRAGFARAIFQDAARRRGLPVIQVSEVSSVDYVTAARRPGRSVLECGKIKEVFGIRQPAWRPYLGTVLGELAGKGGLSGWACGKGADR
jgi:dTDP-4-dehydrorhamnose reductase